MRDAEDVVDALKGVAGIVEDVVGVVKDVAGVVEAAVAC